MILGFVSILTQNEEIFSPPSSFVDSIPTFQNTSSLSVPENSTRKVEFSYSVRPRLCHRALCGGGSSEGEVAREERKKEYILFMLFIYRFQVWGFCGQTFFFFWSIGCLSDAPAVKLGCWGCPGAGNGEGKRKRNKMWLLLTPSTQGFFFFLSVLWAEMRVSHCYFVLCSCCRVLGLGLHAGQAGRKRRGGKQIWQTIPPRVLFHILMFSPIAPAIYFPVYSSS